MKKQYKRSSEILMEIAQDKSSDHLTYRDILNKLGNRAFGLALLFFALPSALPFSIIPGVSFIFSLPVLIFALQMIGGRKTLWLPKVIAERPISHEKIAKVIHTASPYLIKLEKLLKPRWAFMTSLPLEIINGITIAILSILLMFPIPMSNFIFSVLIIFFGLGFTEKDGVFIALGYLGAIIYIAFMYFIILGALKAFFA